METNRRDGTVRKIKGRDKKKREALNRGIIKFKPKRKIQT